MNPLFRRGLALLLCAFSASALGKDCEAPLVADFALPGRDPTTDLSYLSVVNADNYALHRANAFPKMARAEVQLPIARDLLQHAKTYDEFAAKRAQKYVEYGFDYAPAELMLYFQRLLPAQRLDVYSRNCAAASLFQARVTKANRDFVEMALTWRASKDAPQTQVPLANLAVSGARLLGSPPVALQAQPATLTFARNLDVDLRLSVTAGGEAQTVLVPRYIAAPAAAAEAGQCTNAEKIVRAIFRLTLERDPKPAELASQAARLSNHSNSVRQLVQRAVLSAEYERKFTKGKPVEKQLSGFYRRVFARDADENGLKGNADRFRDAAFAAIAMTFLESPEYQSRFGDWTVPGTPPALRYCAAAK
jgi:hypothetical protein